MKNVIITIIILVFSLSCAHEIELVYGESPTTDLEKDIVLEPVSYITLLNSSFADKQEGKTVINGTSVYWTPGDEILVFNSNRSSVFKSTNTENSSNAEFAGKIGIDDSDIYALYPNQEGASMSNGIITVSVPSVQRAQAGTFPKEAFISIAKSSNNNLFFYHLCSLLKIRFSCNGINELTIESRGEETLAGKVNVQIDNNSIPSVVDCLTKDCSITLLAPSGGFKKNTDYYLALLPGTLQNGFKMTAISGTKIGTWEKEDVTTFTRAVYSKATNPDEKMVFKDKIDYSAPDDLITVHIAKKGGLEEALKEFNMTPIRALKIIGVLNDVDFLQLSTYLTDLEYLDLSNVNITTLPKNAFKNNQVIKTLILPSELTTISSGDLSTCAIQTIVLGEKIKTIEGDSFNSCLYLENVKFIEGIDLEEIKSNTFSGCSSLKEIAIPSSVTTIEAKAFDGCTSLSTIYFDSGSKLKTIGGLSGLSSLKRISIPASVTDISVGAFSNCASLEEVCFDENTCIKSVRRWFDGCPSLLEFTIPSSVEEIEPNSFKDNTYISKIKIEGNSNLKSIGSFAFYGCSSLIGFDIPESVSFIEGFAFYGCSRIVRLVFPNHIESIGNYTFYGCNNLTNLTIVNPSIITRIGSFAFCGIPLSFFPFEEYSSLTSIGEQAFSGTAISGDITFPSSLTSIGKYSFSGLNISKITFPEESMINIIESGAFCNCSRLLKVVFDGVNSSCDVNIDSYAFSNCSSLTTFDAEFCVNLNSVGDYAFKDCSSLRVFYNGTVIPASCKNTSFDNIAPNAILKVRPESVSNYKTATGWKSFSSTTALEGYGVLIESISFDPKSYIIHNGESIDLVYSIIPSNPTVSTLDWSSSDSSIATVSEGKVFGVSRGFVTITATSKDGTNIKESCDVEVQQYVTSIELSKTSLVLNESQEQILTATVNPANANDPSITWTSSDESIAKVDQTGKVTAETKGKATITVTAKDGSSIKATCAVVISPLCPAGAVDLGMTTSDGYKLYWATCNLCEFGFVSSPEVYGDYYAWGETDPKENYSWSTYKWGTYNTLTKYNNSRSYGEVDNKSSFSDYGYADDAARVKLGGSWRMPTDEEWTELREQCTWTWTTQNGVNGRLVKSKTTGNSIFLPAAGGRYDTSLRDAGSYGYYWSSSLYTVSPGLAWRVYFGSGNVYRYYDGRYIGFSVRPVSE